MSILTKLSTVNSDLLAKIGICFDSDIQIDDQLSFNKAYRFLNKYFVYSVERDKEKEYTFQIKVSNNDLDLDNAFNLFLSYIELYRKNEESFYNMKHLDFGFYEYTFSVPKNSKLYKLICNYENQFNKDESQAKSSISFSEGLNNYLKANEQGGIVNDVLIKPLINIQVMDPEGYGDIQRNTIVYRNYIDVDSMPSKVYTTFPDVNPQESKFKTGDKVKIIKDYIMDIKRESVNFKGFEGVVYSSLNLVSGMYNQNIVNCSYDVDINGFVVAGINESALELIEQPKKIEYRKDLYDIADDIDGCLLPDYQPKSELIQRKIF